MALSKWPLYQDTDGFKGLCWCMNRRVKLREFKIWKVMSKKSGREVRKDPGLIFATLCGNKKYADVASLMVSSGSIDPDAVMKGDDAGCTPLHIASRNGHLEVVRLLIEAGADIDKAEDGG